MADTKVVGSDDVLRQQPRSDSDSVLTPGGEELQVLAGEIVNTGAKPSQDEVLPDRTITWVFVEATTGQFLDLRKGFISSGNVLAAGTSVPPDEVFEAFHEEVDRDDFAVTCYYQAALFQTNSAYLYALAFALSGDQWSDTTVKTSDPAGTPALGVYRFPTETWKRLIREPEAIDIAPGDIAFPKIQCIVAALVAAKAADLLVKVITDRGLSAVDLFLAHLFADSKGFGSDAAAAILKAEKDDKTQLSESVIKTIYPDSAVRTAFYDRNASIFQAGGSATIAQALAVCETKLNSGFDEVRKLDPEADIFDGLPTSSTDPILPSGGSPIGSGGTVTGVKNGIDRRQFLDELANPALLKKSADMVKGEVGWNAPEGTKLVQLETAFNRAMARGHSVAQALLSVGEDRKRGYYARATYSRPVSDAEFDDFNKTLLPALLAGSNKSQELLGFIATGNASPPVSTAQFANHTQGGNLDSGQHGHPESYFNEGPLKVKYKFLQGGESIPLPGGAPSPGSTGPSSPGTSGSSGSGEPPEHMDGDTEGSGPSGGKFNQPPGTPISPQADHQTIQLSNGVKVDVGKRVAEQFLGFFNDLIKAGAPVKRLGGFGTRPSNSSQHPIGFAIDWQQHSRNVVDPDVQAWISSHRDLLRKLENRWGMSGAENWKNPDTGHFSIERIFGPQHLSASKNASATG